MNLFIKPKYIPWVIKVLKALLNLVLILIIVLPFTYSFNPDDYMGITEGWGDDYLYENEMNAIIVGSLIVNCIIVQVLWPSIARQLLQLSSLAISGFCFLISFMTATMPMQDVLPHVGILLMGTILPILLCWYYLEYLLSRNVKIVEAEIENPSID